MNHKYDITVYYTVQSFNMFKAPVAASAQSKAYLGAHSKLLSLPVSDRQTVAPVSLNHLASGREKAKKHPIIMIPFCNYIYWSKGQDVNVNCKYR